MSAKRRNRKIQNKRSTNVDPYTERYRKASDGAKAARAAARSRGIGEAHFDEVHIGVDISQARIVSASLVPEGQGTGYIISVGEHEEAPGGEGPRFEADPIDQPLADWERELLYGSPEEAVRSEAASDAASVGQRGPAGAEGELPEASAHEPEAGQAAHWIFFEQEVNFLPTYVGKSTCFCDIRADHWQELGEN